MPKQLKCRRGHDRVPENLTKAGSCRECKKLTQAAWLKTEKGIAHMRRGRATWRERNPTYHRDKALLESYGLTHEEVLKKIEDQGGVCAICGCSMEKPNVDHSHTTGRVRGILCPQCNMGIGNLKDSPELLEKAAAYLRSHEE